MLRMLGSLFDALPLGLVVLDAHERVVVYNRAEERLAARSRHSVMGKRFFEEVAPCMDIRELGRDFRANIGCNPIDVTVEMSFPFGHLERPRDVRVRMASFDVDGAPYGFLIIEDTSLQRSIERMRTQLQHLLVHDLKNPLTSTMINLQLLEESPTIRDGTDALELVEGALDSIKRASRMAVSMLDISRLETGALEPKRTACSVEALFARVLNDNHALAKLSHRQIKTVRCDLEISVDEDLLVRALDNLVENALRYGNVVVLSTRVEHGQVTIEVADDGPGIPEAIRGQLFDPYVQASEPQTRALNRGLGLTFVRLVARAHGGDAELHCPAEGGSVFRLRGVATMP